ncbi:transmembrane protease serine 9-like [Neocloeon triangulifer]|uniref:transmembrane protease serine 9-like n=1 Tax=Neocloeon triangulifer TaxID=2078957 RepID=UPI00286F4CB5|nr:transmembrane protease serine 9-like [Neocloeon triangulifer]
MRTATFASASIIIQLAALVIAGDALTFKYRSFPKTQIQKSSWPASMPKIPAGTKTKTVPQPAGSGLLSKRFIEKQIVGGSSASLGQFPWQAFLGIESSYLCGASLITTMWVLSAAHCHGSYYVVTLGSISRSTPSSGAVSLNTAISYVHEGYDDNNLNNDIMLIRLPSNVTLTDTIRTVSLPPNTAGSFAGELATISGFGKTSDAAGPSATLNFVDMTILNNTQSAVYYGDYIIGTTICAQQPTKSTCQGDSGGPLVLKNSDGVWMQIGIVSFGSSSGCLAAPSCFSRVSSYIDWISQKISSDSDGSSTSTTSAVGTDSTSSSTITTKTTKTSTKKTTTTQAPKLLNCADKDFSDMGKCCNPRTKEFAQVKGDSALKACKGNAASLNIINKYVLNKFQRPKFSNAINFSDPKLQQAFGQEACFLNCYLGNKSIIQNNVLDRNAFLQDLILKGQDNQDWISILNATSSNCFDIVDGLGALTFKQGKKTCDGTAVVALQCIQYFIIDLCPDFGNACSKKYTFFDTCAQNNIFGTSASTQKMRQNIIAAASSLHNSHFGNSRTSGR